MNEYRFYRSKLHALLWMIPFVVLIIFGFILFKKYYETLDMFSTLMVVSFGLILIIIFIVFFICWLVSLKNAKKSYIELLKKSIRINNCHGILTKKDFIEIKYNEIKEIKIFFDLHYLCYNIDIYKKWCTWKHCVATFELKICDNTCFVDILNLHWITTLRQWHF